MKSINDEQISKIIYSRIKHAVSIVIISNSEAYDHARALGLAKGLSYSSKIRSISSADIASLSKKERELLIDQTDLVIAVGFEEEYSETHCLILDLKNSGAYVIGINEIRNSFMENYSSYTITQLPGVMRKVVRFCKGRDVCNEEDYHMVVGDQA
jgi:hypothetical protein